MDTISREHESEGAMPDGATTLGQRLRAVREEHGFTQATLSRALGGFPTPSAISRLEADQVPNPGFYTLAAFARVYGLSRLAFFRRLHLIEEGEEHAGEVTPREKISMLLRQHPELNPGIAHLANEPLPYVLHVLEGMIRAQQTQQPGREETSRAEEPRRRARKAS